MFGQTFLLWALSYLLHSTLLFLVSRIVLMLPFLTSSKQRELVLRFALFCAIPTSILQTVFGLGINLTTLGTPITTVVPNPDPFILSTGMWVSVLLFIWGFALMFLLVRYIFARNQFLSGIRPLTPVNSAHILDALEDIQRSLPKPINVSVAVSERLNSPVTVGGKYIYLPSQCLHDLNSFQLRCLFAHEVAHIARRDNLWMIAYKLIASVFFFQPLNRIIINDLNDTSEKLCDKWAVEVTGNRFELARCLVTVASWYSVPGYNTHFPGAVNKKSQLKQRIELLMAKQEESGPLYRKSLYAVFGTVMVAMVLLGPGFSLSQADPPERKMTVEHKVEVAVEQQVNVEVEQEVEVDPISF